MKDNKELKLKGKLSTGWFKLNKENGNTGNACIILSIEDLAKQLTDDDIVALAKQKHIIYIRADISPEPIKPMSEEEIHNLVADYFSYDETIKLARDIFYQQRKELATALHSKLYPEKPLPPKEEQQNPNWKNCPCYCIGNYCHPIPEKVEEIEELSLVRSKSFNYPKVCFNMLEDLLDTLQEDRNKINELVRAWNEKI